MSAGPGRWRGRHVLVNGNFADVKCPKLTHTISYDTEQVTLVRFSALAAPTLLCAGLLIGASVHLGEGRVWSGEPITSIRN